MANVKAWAKGGGKTVSEGRMKELSKTANDLSAKADKSDYEILRDRAEKASKEATTSDQHFHASFDHMHASNAALKNNDLANYHKHNAKRDEHRATHHRMEAKKGAHPDDIKRDEQGKFAPK